MPKQWRRTGLSLAVVACLALGAGATAVATGSHDSPAKGLEPKAAVLAAAWPDEKKAAWNAGLDKKAAHLAERGIAVETMEVAPGVRGIVGTHELKRTLKDIVGGTK